MNLPPINATRLWERAEALSRITRPDLPWTRRAFTGLFLEARTWLGQQFQDAGLAVHLDAGGNLVGRREGTVAGLAPIISGSHCDTVVAGGRYDGIAGVLAALEVAQTLHEQGVRLSHPFEVIDFLSEEPSDYGSSCIGSRAFSGGLEPSMLLSANAEGETLAQALARIGVEPATLAQADRGPNSTAAYVELHIEQGPVLEARGLPIGVVTNIAGIRRVRIAVTGQADHAGTTPMDIRKDALVGAALVVQQAHADAIRQSGQPHYVVATVGRLVVHPNVANAVPGRVEMVLEVRSDDTGVLDVFPEQLLASVAAELAALGLGVALTHVSRSAPTACAPLVMDAVEAASRALGYASQRMPSGAGHDGVYVAPTGPIGMVFIPCLGGRSHCPEESITPAQFLAGTQVLYDTILRLDATLAGRH